MSDGVAGPKAEAPPPRIADKTPSKVDKHKSKTDAWNPLLEKGATITELRADQNSQVRLLASTCAAAGAANRPLARGRIP